ncbi:hypothetical protein L195_g037042, partial [Trifolium pratense]
MSRCSHSRLVVRVRSFTVYYLLTPFWAVSKTKDIIVLDLEFGVLVFWFLEQWRRRHAILFGVINQLMFDPFLPIRSANVAFYGLPLSMRFGVAVLLIGWTVVVLIRHTTVVSFGLATVVGILSPLKGCWSKFIYEIVVLMDMFLFKNYNAPRLGPVGSCSHFGL